MKSQESDMNESFRAKPSSFGSDTTVGTIRSSLVVEFFVGNSPYWYGC